MAEGVELCVTEGFTLGVTKGFALGVTEGFALGVTDGSTLGVTDGDGLGVVDRRCSTTANPCGCKATESPVPSDTSFAVLSYDRHVAFLPAWTGTVSVLALSVALCSRTVSSSPS